MDEFLCLTLLAQPGETEAAFKLRLTEFWTHMLRTRPDDYEGVYAEARNFDEEDGRTCRQYMVVIEAIDAVTAELTAKGVEFVEVDRDDTYNKAEASSSEWFQIPHD
ncbi:MAG: hypothetical protein MUF18_17945 [Fimbriiglobus sp.]|jgi:hypothetical protein|nr:hypothetical protein [Fimbriiglobus sp.]